MMLINKKSEENIFPYLVMGAELTAELVIEEEIFFNCMEEYTSWYRNYQLRSKIKLNEDTWKCRCPNLM